jgi:VanZ family protein
MDLERKVLLRIEQLGQDREPRRVWDIAENFFPMFAPKVMQRCAAQWPFMNDALRLGPVDDFPRLADEGPRRQALPVKRFQSAPAPDSFHENRLEHERLNETRFRHAAKISTSPALVVSFLVRGFLKYWLPVLAWMIFIFMGSTDLLSAEHTSRFIGPFLRWFVPDLSDATIASIQLVVRKGAHLTEYAILAVLLYRALHQDHRRIGKAFIVCFLIAAGYAALDELHQAFVASRTGSPWDVMIDCIGALLGVVIYWIAAGNRKSKIEIRK